MTCDLNTHNTEPILHPLEDLAPQLPNNCEVLQHWKGLRKGEKIPRWTDFDPLEIPEYLAGCMILQFNSEDDVRLSLFGTELVDRLGSDATGANFFDFYRGEPMDQVQARSRIIRTKPAIALGVLVRKPPGHAPRQMEILTLPFVSAQGEVDHFLMSLGHMNFDSEIASGSLSGIQESTHHSFFAL